MREHGFENAVLWVYSPVTADLVDLVPHKALVYDCVDRHSAYGGLMDPALVDAMELELAKKRITSLPPLTRWLTACAPCSRRRI